MADRQGQSVGCIIRTRNGLQFQQPFRHIHHLAFFRLSVTGYGQLDLGGRVLIEWNSAVLRCAEDHASAVSYGNAGGKIGIKKQLFYRNCIWLELPDQRLHVTADLI